MTDCPYCPYVNVTEEHIIECKEGGRRVSRKSLLAYQAQKERALIKRLELKKEEEETNKLIAFFEELGGHQD